MLSQSHVLIRFILRVYVSHCSISVVSRFLSLSLSVCSKRQLLFFSVCIFPRRASLVTFYQFSVDTRRFFLLAVGFDASIFVRRSYLLKMECKFVHRLLKTSIVL